MNTQPKSNASGILLALGGGIILSMNDLAIKALSGAYALHQIILIRAFIGISLALALMWISKPGFRQILTQRPGAHLIRVSIVMVSNITYIMVTNKGDTKATATASAKGIRERPTK